MWNLKVNWGCLYVGMDWMGYTVALVIVTPVPTVYPIPSHPIPLWSLVRQGGQFGQDGLVGQDGLGGQGGHCDEDGQCGQGSWDGHFVSK